MDMDFIRKTRWGGEGTLARCIAGAKVWEWQREVAKVSQGKSHRVRSLGFP